MSKGADLLVSRLPGRLRLRHGALRNPALSGRLAAEFSAWDGVASATGNPVAGSLLVIYDAARIVPAEMEARIAAVVAPACGRDAGEGDGGRVSRPALPAGSLLRRLNRPAKIGMLGSLSLSLAALAVNRRLHAAAGGLYLAFLVLHLARHRESLTK